jgi:hypothetical protein
MLNLQEVVYYECSQSPLAACCLGGVPCVENCHTFTNNCTKFSVPATLCEAVRAEHRVRVVPFSCVCTSVFCSRLCHNWLQMSDANSKFSYLVVCYSSCCTPGHTGFTTPRASFTSNFTCILVVQNRKNVAIVFCENCSFKLRGIGQRMTGNKSRSSHGRVHGKSKCAPSSLFSSTQSADCWRG